MLHFPVINSSGLPAPRCICFSNVCDEHGPVVVFETSAIQGIRTFALRPLQALKHAKVPCCTHILVYIKALAETARLCLECFPVKLTAYLKNLFV